VFLSAAETEIVRRELTTAADLLADAHETPDSLASLAAMTTAIDVLTATQHELVNVLLDRGATWSVIAEALATNSAGAQRRFPRREARSASSEDQPSSE
jgi:hypothetical protein